METENEQAQVETVEQEEQVSEETTEVQEESQEEAQETDDVTLSKSELKKLQRKAYAYDAIKEGKTEQKTAKPLSEKTDLSAYDVKFERLELRADGYSPDEIDAIMELGGAKALKNPVVKSAVQAMRAEKKSKDASESPSSKSPVYKKFTQADLSNMSSKELEKILPQD